MYLNCFTNLSKENVKILDIWVIEIFFVLFGYHFQKLHVFRNILLTQLVLVLMVNEIFSFKVIAFFGIWLKTKIYFKKLSYKVFLFFYVLENAIFFVGVVVSKVPAKLVLIFFPSPDNHSAQHLLYPVRRLVGYSQFVGPVCSLWSILLKWPNHLKRRFLIYLRINYAVAS